MNRKGKHKLRPTLVQTIIGLIDTQEEFSTVSAEKVRDAADEYYEREQGKFGRFLVARETLTQGQLDLALALQADLAGEHDKFIEHMKKAVDDLRSHIQLAANETTVIAEALQKVVAYDD